MLRTKVFLVYIAILDWRKRLHISWWISFNVFILVMLALDLGVFHRKASVISVKEALIWSVIWTVLALLFNVGIFFLMGGEPALQFFTGYLIERALSMDNVFVFYLVFAAFGIPCLYQYRVLFWGIIGALIMRALLITCGITLVNNFHWVIYVFGAFLIITGIKMAVSKDTEVHPEKNPALKMFRKIMPITADLHDEKFFVRIKGAIYATPLFVVLLLVETTDVVFALDSIPAIIAITRDSFLVYTSNIFAILGLRALYFALAGIVSLFEYMHYGFAVILSFVGVKMLISKFYEIPILVSLSVIAGVLVISMLASVIKARICGSVNLLDKLTDESAEECKAGAGQVITENAESLETNGARKA